MTISVSIFDSDEGYLTQLEAELRNTSYCNVVATALTEEAAFDAIKNIRADVFILDICMWGADGVRLIESIKQAHPHSDVMVLTSLGDGVHPIQCIKGGATGYILKESSFAQICQAVLSLRNGGTPISPLVARNLFRELFTDDIKEAPPVRQTIFTDREQQVMNYLAQGFSVILIADLARISTHTVNQHLRNIYRKLGVRSRSQAVYAAQKSGLVDKNLELLV